MILILIQILQMYIKLSWSVDLNPQDDLNSQTIEKTFNEAQIDIFEKCFIDKIRPILIIGNWTMYKSNQLFQLSLSSMFVMGLKKNDSLQYYMIKEKRYIIEPNNTELFPVTKFVIEATDVVYLQIALYKLKNSVFWNVYGFFLISNIKAVNSCNFVYPFLNVIWKFNILNAVFMCRNSSHGVALYTFNPYNTIIPKLWKKSDSYVKENGHPFTIYMIFYEKAKNLSSICNVINHDKIKNLHNYPIKIADMAVNITVKEIGNQTVIKDFFNIEHHLLRIVWDKLKANVTHVVFSGSQTGKIDATDGIPSGVIKKVLDGEFEARSVYDFQRGLWRNEVNLFRKSGRCFVITMEAMSMQEQMAMIFPMELRCILGISFLVITLLLSYWLKVTWAETMTEVLRIAVGAPMIRLQPGTLSTCAIFAWLIVALMVLSSFMQSQLSAMLSVASKKHRNLRNLNDLMDNYEVYGSPFLAASFQTAVRTKIHQDKNGTECLQLIRNDPKIACLLGLRYARYLVQEDDGLYIWIDHTYDDYDVILFRDDSPLKDTFEKIYLRLFQHGFLKYLMNLEIPRYKKHYTEYYKDISVGQLSYAFYFLRGAYTIGSFIFFMELNFSRMSRYFREIKKRVW